MATTTTGTPAASPAVSGCDRPPTRIHVTLSGRGAENNSGSGQSSYNEDHPEPNIRWLGSETAIMKQQRWSLLLPESPYELLVRAQRVELPALDTMRDDEHVASKFPGCSLLGLTIVSLSGTAPLDAIVLGKCVWNEADEDRASSMTLRKIESQCYAEWPNTIPVCPICARHAANDGSKQYYLLAYPAIELSESRNGTKGQLKHCMLPRLTCVACLEGLLERGNHIIPVQLYNSMRAQNRNSDQSHTPTTTAKANRGPIGVDIPLYPTNVPALHFLRRMDPSYPYLDRKVPPPSLCHGLLPIDLTAVLDVAQLMVFLGLAGTLTAMDHCKRQEMVTMLTGMPGFNLRKGKKETLAPSPGDRVRFRLIRCDHCHKVIPTHTHVPKCSLCQAVIYCGTKCQTKHWKLQHKKECSGRKSSKSSRSSALHEEPKQNMRDKNVVVTDDSVGEHTQQQPNNKGDKKKSKAATR